MDVAPCSASAMRSASTKRLRMVALLAAAASARRAASFSGVKGFLVICSVVVVALISCVFVMVNTSFLLSWRWTCAARGNRGILFLWFVVEACGPRPDDNIAQVYVHRQFIFWEILWT